MTDRMSRRTALKYAGLITLAAQGWSALAATAAVSPARGYGPDPDLSKRPVTWSRTLTASQLAMLASLCEIILPAEPPHPSARAIGVHEFLDEWVSAPYPLMQEDRALILSGLISLDGYLRNQHGVAFHEASLAQQANAFDQHCSDSSSIGFARRLIELVCDGYYTTRKGHAAIGYVGNVALKRFAGPPPEVVRRLDEALAALPNSSIPLSQ